MAFVDNEQARLLKDGAGHGSGGRDREQDQPIPDPEAAAAAEAVLEHAQGVGVRGVQAQRAHHHLW